MQSSHPGNIPFLLRKTVSVLRRPRMQRGEAAVSAEYSAGWAAHREHLARASNLDEWLCIAGAETQPEFHNRDGRLAWGEFHSAAYYREVLLQALRRHFPQARSVTEFGCGLGRNLLFLKRAWPALNVAGYELCVPGVEVGREAARKFGFDIPYAQLDYLRDPPEKYVLPKADVAFTMFSLEQLPAGVDVALRNILGQAHMGSIHLEPVPENYPLSLRGVLGRIDHWKVDYLKGFDQAVRTLPGVQVHVEAMASAHNPLMFPSQYVLKKR